MKRRTKLGVEKLESRRLLAACSSLTGQGTFSNPYQLGTLSGANEFTGCPALLDGFARYYSFTFSQTPSAGSRAIASFNRAPNQGYVSMGLHNTALNGGGILVPSGTLSSNGTYNERSIDFTPTQRASYPLLAGTYLLGVSNAFANGIAPSFDLTVHGPGTTPAPVAPAPPSNPNLVVSTGGNLLNGNLDFGQVAQGEMNVERTFTIQNTGTGILIVGDVLLDGSDTGFEVTDQPDLLILPGGRTSFRIAMLTDSTGIKSTSFFFVHTGGNVLFSTSISGEVTAVEDESEIQIRGNGIEIRDGDSSPRPNDQSDFEAVAVGSMVTKTFTIHNIGLSDLALTGDPLVDIVGDESLAFRIITIPDQTVTANGETSFQVEFTPVSSGEHHATVRIENNDSDESDYSFDIRGIGLASGSISGRVFRDANLDRIATVTSDGTVTPSIGLTGSDPDGQPVHGLAYDSRDRMLYGIKGATDELFQFDLQTGQGTRLGTLPSDIGFGLTYNPIDDQLYTYRHGSLIRIDPDTMTTEVINNQGADVVVGSLTYNPLDGLIYAHSTGSTRLQAFNPTTGNGPLIAANPSFATSFASAHNGVDLVFAEASDSNDFVGFDPQTGSSSAVLPSGTELPVANGMAFVPAQMSDGAWQVILAPGQSVTGRNFSQSENAPASGPSWQNQDEVTDVNNDAVTSAVDALIIINELSQLQFSAGDRELPQRTDQHEFFYDVNGDGFVSAVDALMVINFLSSSDGEGESIRSPTDAIDSSAARLSSSPGPESANGLLESEFAGLTANVPPHDRVGGLTQRSNNLFRYDTSAANVDRHDSNQNVTSDWEDILSSVADELASQWS